MSLSEKLATERKKKGMSQEDLASKLGVTRQAVSKWESGQSEPDITTLNKICDAFEISIQQFFADDEPYKPVNPSSQNDRSRALIMMQIMLLVIFIAGAVYLTLETYSENAYGVTAGLEAAAFGAVTISPVLYIITAIMLYKNKQ
jgi:transcriptional regulator with XRE-family HTH domain